MRGSFLDTGYSNHIVVHVNLNIHSVRLCEGGER